MDAIHNRHFDSKRRPAGAGRQNKSAAAKTAIGDLTDRYMTMEINGLKAAFENDSNAGSSDKTAWGSRFAARKNAPRDARGHVLPQPTNFEPVY